MNFRSVMWIIWVVLVAVWLSGCSRQEVLLRDMGEREANEIVSVLYEAQIASHKQLDAKTKTYAVAVNADNLPRALAVLQSQGLPRQSRASINELFKSQGFAPTPFEERVKYIYGVTQELERTIDLLEGVLHTRVHLVIPEQNKRVKEVVPAKASILITYDERYNIDLHLPKVRKLVAEAIENLSADRVEIFATPVKADVRRTQNHASQWFGVTVQDTEKTVVALLLGVLALGWLFALGIGALFYKEIGAWFAKHTQKS